MRTSRRRYELRLPDQLCQQVEDLAGRHGLGFGPAIRMLIGRSLAAEARLGLEPPVESAATLAALVAAEHAVLMVASILPEGEQRMSALARRAAQAAEERLQLVRGQTGAGDEPL